MERDPNAKGHEPTLAVGDSVGEAATLAAPRASADTPTLPVTEGAGHNPPEMPASWPSSSAGDPAEPTSHLLRYRLGEVIGRGGMGEVVSAHDEQIGRSVAIKRMRGAAAGPEAVARFVREARIQGRLDHPAVVPVHELWRDHSGQPFFVMKQLSGVTLAEVLARLARGDAAAVREYPRQRLLRAFSEVCLAIEFAHTRRVVHRDLKPANIMLGDFGEVYVLDWGIARVLDDADQDGGSANEAADAHATMVGSVLGTPGYMAPEQIRGGSDVDHRADVYSLGCILFEMLALEPVHPAGVQGLASTLTGGDARPSLRAPDRGIAPELDAICLAATMLDRSDRHASARELGDAVQRFLDGDRDLAMRKQLAQSEVATARAALAHGNDANDRRTAIRAAARALALDPQSPEPADLVGRLMLEPPDQVPAEVERAIAELDLDALDHARRLIALSSVTYFAFVPILWLAGFHELWSYAAGSLFAGSNTLIARFSRREQMLVASRVILVFWALLIGLMAVITTPLLIAPGIAVIVSMSIATHTSVVRGWILALVTTSAVLVPWLFSVIGVLPPSVVVVDNTIVLHAGAGRLDPTATLVGSAAFIVLMIAMATALSRTLANDRRAAQRTVQIQAWQLRQLVVRAPTQIPRAEAA